MVLFPIIPLGIYVLSSYPEILERINSVTGKPDTYQSEFEKSEDDNPGTSSSYDDYYSIGIVVAVSLVPMFIYVFLRCCLQSTRKSMLLNYVNRWNRRIANGVFLVLGGEGRTQRGMVIGSEGGGDYGAFYYATWDAKGILVRGFLHVFVHYSCRADWCQKNGVPFVPPVPVNQQTMEHQLGGTATQNPHLTGFQAPAGYSLVPQEYRVPDGYRLVPISQDLPPSYADSKV